MELGHVLVKLWSMHRRVKQQNRFYEQKHIYLRELHETGSLGEGKAIQDKSTLRNDMAGLNDLLWQKIPDTKPSEKSRLQSESSGLTVDWCLPIFSELCWRMPDWTPGRLCCLRKLQHIQSSSENMITHAHLKRRRSNTKGLTPLLRNLEIWRSSPYYSPSQELINRNYVKHTSIYLPFLW